MKKLIYTMFLLLPFLTLSCEGPEGGEEIEDVKPSPAEIKQKLLIGHWIDEGTKEEYLDYNKKVVSSRIIAPSGRDHVFNGNTVTIYEEGKIMTQVDYITGGGASYFYLTFHVPGRMIFNQREVLELDEEKLTFVDQHFLPNGYLYYTNKFSRRK
jgi:hypothetical protein